MAVERVINPALLQNAVYKMEKLSIVMSVLIIHVKNTAEAVRYLSEKEMQPVYLDCCHSFPVWTLSSLSDSRRGICHRQGRTSGTDLCFPVFLTYPYNRPFLTTGRWRKNVLYPVSGLWNPLRNPGADL